MDRREFIGWVSIGALTNSLPVVLAACSFSKQKPQAKKESAKIDSSMRKDGFQALGTIQELGEKGFILNKQNLAKPVLVVRNPDSISSLCAVNPTCTHQGCTVEWKTDTKLFTCPCHGSKFSPNGNVLEDPAKKPLKTFKAKEENGLVLVKAL